MIGAEERVLDPARVRTARVDARMTQVRLAIAAGVSPSTVHRIETGRHPRTQELTAKALADALGVPLDSLLVHDASVAHASSAVGNPPGPAEVPALSASAAGPGSPEGA